mgnify:CR=1 FL=1
MEKRETKGLFRQEALDRLRSPDQLDKLFTPTTPVAWVALASVMLLIVSAFIWSIFGVMANKVNGTGIIMDSAGVVNISHVASGRLGEVKVKVGDRVRQGQVVAIMEQPALEAKIARLNREMIATKSRSELDANVATLNELQAQLERESQVISQADGVIADQIVAGPGEYITPGAPLLSVRLDEQQRGEMMVLLYVPVLEGKKIQPGMLVQVSPGSVDSSEYGTMVGQVRSISGYPVLGDSITGWTGNKELTNWIIKQSGGAAIEVKVDLIKDSDTKSGYLWSSIYGSPKPITPGTVCTGNVVVERQAPITKAFLKLNQWLRSD